MGTKKAGTKSKTVLKPKAIDVKLLETNVVPKYGVPIFVADDLIDKAQMSKLKKDFEELKKIMCEKALKSMDEELLNQCSVPADIKPGDHIHTHTLPSGKKVHFSLSFPFEEKIAGGTTKQPDKYLDPWYAHYEQQPLPEEDNGCVYPAYPVDKITHGTRYCVYCQKKLATVWVGNVTPKCGRKVLAGWCKSHAKEYANHYVYKAGPGGTMCSWNVDMGMILIPPEGLNHEIDAA